VDLCGSLSLGCMLVLCAHPLAADQVTTARMWAQPIHSGARIGKDVRNGQGRDTAGRGGDVLGEFYIPNGIRRPPKC